jgi:uncharacterized protein YecT (DUF1311 family)
MIAAALALLFASTQSPATPPEPPEMTLFGQCIARGNDTNATYSQCYGEAIAAADARLEQRFALLRDSVSDQSDPQGGTSARAAVETGQSLWRAFFAQACAHYWTAEYGSMHRSIIGPQCSLDILLERIGQIDRLLEAQESLAGE